MNRMQKLAPAIDGAMTVLLLLLMSFGATGQEPHEWMGILLGLLVILHCAVNRRWFSSLFRGRYDGFRAVSVLVTIAALLAILALSVSGLIMARYTFIHIPFRAGISSARLVHLSASYWGFLFLSLHLGMQAPRLFSRLRGAGLLPRRPSSALRAAAGALLLAAAAYGAYLASEAQMLSYMLLRMEFAFFDPTQSVPSAFFDHFCMMTLFAGAAYLALPLLRRH